MRLWVGVINEMMSLHLTATSTGKTLLRRYKAAIADRNMQREAHRGFTASLPLDLVSTWEKMCADWDADGFPKTVPNPFHTLDASKYLLLRIYLPHTDESAPP